MTEWFSIIGYVLLIYSCSVGFKLFAGEGNISDLIETGQGDLVKQLAFIACLSLAMLAIFTSKVKARIIYLQPYFLFACVIFLYFGLTLTWSEVPDVAFRRLVNTVIVFMCGYTFVSILGIEKSLNILQLVLLILIGLSYLSIPIVPEAKHTYSALDFELVGSWKGLFPHKNVSGMLASILVGLLVIDYFRAKKTYLLILVFLCTLFLLMTKSKSSIYLLIPTLIYAFYMSSNFDRRVVSFVASLSFVFLIFFVFLLFLFVLNKVISSDAFTGRGGIWEVVSAIIADNYLLGVGFSSIFHVGLNSPLYDYTSGWEVLAASAHNGYFDIAAQTGLIGFLLTVIFLYLIVRMLTMDWGLRNLVLKMSFLFVFMLLHNITESSLFDTAKSGWLIMVLVYSMVVQLGREKNNG
ncbi:O-antigen ligase family protein [Chitinibacter sp. FCG-7]|uniref:O-antigen ligase family protein n=1 Tax=Chitinibacter mangrovi TaxID=3153927 RepID=A0AAU7F5U0_9NEIS